MLGALLFISEESLGAWAKNFGGSKRKEAKVEDALTISRAHILVEGGR